MGEAIIKDPENISCTMQFTLTLRDWKLIRKTLRSNAAYVELELINDITVLVNKLENTLYSDLP